MAGRGSRGRSPDSSRRSLFTSLAETADVASLHVTSDRKYKRARAIERQN